MAESHMLSHSSEQFLRKEETAAETFARSALFAAIQSPLNGIAQLAEHATGKNILPNVQIIEPSKNTGSFSELAGSVTATTVEAALMVAATHRLIPLEGVKSAGARALVAGGLGSVYGGVFTPVGNNEDFTSTRFRNALTGATAFAGLSAFRTVYKDVLPMKDITVTNGILARDFKTVVAAGAYGTMMGGSYVGILGGIDEMVGKTREGKQPVFFPELLRRNRPDFRPEQPRR